MHWKWRLTICWLLLGAGITLAQGTSVSPASQPATPSGLFLDEKYDNGQLKSHYSILPSGVKHGVYVLFYPDGKKQERGAYAKGELDDVRQVFYPSGQVEILENYKRGKLDGPRQ